jgi:hypothetical protein
VTLSRYDSCPCHYERRCRRATPCIEDISLGEVIAAVERRLGPASPERGTDLSSREGARD